MPAQADNAPKQPAGIEATIGQPQDCPVLRDGWTQLSPHSSPRAAPRARLVRGPNRPGHGDRTPARDDTNCAHHTPRPPDGGVEGQRQLGPGPEEDRPVQSGHQTGGALQRLTCGTRFVGRLAAPCIEALCERGALLPHRHGQKRRHGEAATRPRHGNLVTPQGQPPCLGLPQVWHMR